MNLYIFNQTRRHGSMYGVGSYIRELTVALKDTTIKISVVTLTSEKPQIQSEEIEGIQYWYFPTPIQWMENSPEQWALYYRNIVYLLRLHIKDKNGLIFHINYMECKPLADALKIFFDCKTVLVVHYLRSVMTLSGNINQLRKIISQSDKPKNTEEIAAKESFLREMELLQSRAVDKIICLSNHTFDMLYQDYQIEKRKMTVIYNGLSDMKKPESDIRLLRKKWHVSSEEKIILFVGRLNDAKGLGYLTKAFRKLLDEFPNSRLMIAGNGNYDTYLQDTKDICTKITFTGFLYKEELCELYQIADIGVVSSLFETFGYVAVEMMMFGLPVVSTATSGLNEVVADSCGLKTPVTILPDRMEIDIPLLSEKILYLLQHPIKAKQMGLNGRTRYLERYSIPAFKRNMFDFYYSLLNN